MPAPSGLPFPGPVAVFEAPAHWQAIDFISDLHLSLSTPRGFDAWAAHLRSTRADAVFILGDLFEAWVGDDVAPSSFEARCADVLREAAQERVIGFMAGNRDFLVGASMLERAGSMRLADPTVAVAFGSRTLLSHGDVLCLSDVAYQRYRRVVHRPWLRNAFLALPRKIREAVGRLMRARSGTRPALPAAYFDLDASAMAGWMQAAQATAFVHGHTHAPASHAVEAAGMRHVMTDWHLDGSGPPRAEVLRWSAAGFARIAPERRAHPAP